MRTFLQAEAARDRPSRRRTWAPLAVTVTVAAIAFGGYVTATQLDDGRGGAGLQSAGPSGDSDPEPTSHPEPTLDDRPEGDPARNLLTDGAGPSDAGERCLDAIRREYRRGGDTPPDLSDFETRVVAESKQMTTVVVSDGEITRTCNVDPDTAVSRELGPQPPAKRRFDFAANSALNYGMGDGTIVWAGGPAPEGVESITYVFPDGGAAEAVIEDGYWAMQYFTRNDIPIRGTVRVVLEGPGETEVVKLNTYSAGCNQVSHGC